MSQPPLLRKSVHCLVSVGEVISELVGDARGHCGRCQEQSAAGRVQEVSFSRAESPFREKDGVPFTSSLLGK